MKRSIVAMFERRTDAENALRDVLNNGISAERVGMVAGDARAEAKRTRDADGGEVAGAAAAGAAAGIAGLTALAIPAVGTALLAGAAGALGVTGAQAAEQEHAEPELHDVLVRAGLSEEQADVYEDDIRGGRSVVAVTAEEDQVDQLHALFKEHRSSNIEFRKRD